MAEQLAPRRGLHHRLYDWTLHWAAHRHAEAALFLVALAEASFFPIPPDVLLMAMGMARPKRVMRFALVTLTGSLVGAAIGYAIGWGVWQGIEGWAFAHLGALGFTPANFAKVQVLYLDNAFLALFAAAFSPIPFKVFTISAGMFGVSLPVFVVASTIGRAGRFFLVGWLIGWLGSAAKEFIEKYLGWLTFAFVVLLVAGFAAIRFLH